MLVTVHKILVPHRAIRHKQAHDQHVYIVFLTLGSRSFKDPNDRRRKKGGGGVRGVSPTPNNFGKGGG